MQAVAVAEARAVAVPWYIWSAVAAITCGVVGGVWDISWHESVGRDTFWTAPHILIYLGGILAGFSSGYLILATTYGREPYLADASVSIWGFRGPLGAFLCAWGAIAMITSAPFDNWWHNAYGLDVKILSPPHILLALGLTGIRFGTLVLILPALNRAHGESRVKLQALLYYALVFMFGLTVGIMQEMTFRNYMHGARFYLVLALTAPVWLGVTSRVLPQRWACTIVTAIYTAWHLAFHLDSAAGARRAEARAGVFPGDAPHSARFSDAADRAGDRVRSRAAAHDGLEAMDAGAGPGLDVLRGIPCRAVAVREFSDVARLAQLVLRNPLLSIFPSAHVGLGPQCIHASGSDSGAVLVAYGAGTGRRDRDHARGHRLGRVDASPSPVNSATRVVTSFGCDGH